MENGPGRELRIVGGDRSKITKIILAGYYTQEITNASDFAGKIVRMNDLPAGVHDPKSTSAYQLELSLLERTQQLPDTVQMAGTQGEFVIP